MRRGALVALLSIALAPLVALAFLRLGLFTPLFNLALSRGLADKTPLEVRVGSLRSDIFSFIEADDVVVLAPVQGAKIPLLTLDNLRLEFLLWQALRGRLDWQESLRLARLRGLKLFLLREPGGEWNLSTARGSGKAKVRDRGEARMLILPASRIELEDSELVLNDEVRGFRATIDDLQGSLDTRALPLLAFNLNGRTDGHTRENLSLAGEWNQDQGSFYGRLNLERVELSRYLNYFLPGKSLRFTSGTASLSVRLRRETGQGELDASGKAVLQGGTLNLPGVVEPLSQIEGAVAFDQGALRFRQVQAHFLGSDWTARGSIEDLRHPRFNVVVSDPAVPLEALSQQVRGLGLLALTGTASVTASMQGPVKSPSVEATLAIPWLGMAGAELTGVSATAGLQGHRLEVRRLSGAIWGGRVLGSAQMDLGKDGGIKADLALDGVRLESARLHGRRPLPFDGLARARLSVGGLVRAPVMVLDLDVSGSRLGSVQLKGLTMHADYSQAKGLKSAFSSTGGHLSGEVGFSGGPDAAFRDTRITLGQLDLSSTARGLASMGETMALPKAASELFAGLQGRIEGLLDAVLTVEGPLKSPTVWLHASLPQGRLHPDEGWADLNAPKEGLELRLFGNLGFHAGELLLGRGDETLKAFLGPRKGGFELQALGRYPLRKDGQPGHLALAADLDLHFLDTVDVFAKSQGHLAADVVLGGTAASPVADGSIKVTDFSCEPKKYLAPVKDGRLTVLFRGQDIEVSDLSFKSGGSVNAAGSLDLSAGLPGLRGYVDVNTDAAGIHLQNWAGMGSGNLVLAPLSLRLSGEGEPLGVSGRIQLSDALIVYAGKAHSDADAAAAEGADAAGGAASPASGGHRPLDLDLHVGLGANVWYEKRQSKTVDLSDPRKWISDAIESARETLLQPDVSFRLAPTRDDFVIQGITPKLELHGEVAVDRGRMTIMENDFDINNDKGPAIVRFEGDHADISGTASARMHYIRDDPLTGRPRQKTVVVYVELTPRSEQERQDAGLENLFLNFKQGFDSDPQIVTDDSDLQQQACVNLVMLGDPMVDVGALPGGGSASAASPGGAGEQGATVANSGLGAVTSGFLRKEVAELLRKFNIMGSNWVDVARVTPRIRYQAIGASAAQAPGAAAAVQSSSSSSNSQYDIDWTLELGKSIGDKIYTSVQAMTFGENARDIVLVANQSNVTVQSYGLRTGVEYQVSPYRTFEIYGNFGCDDNLDPVAYNGQDQFQNPNISAVVQLRNTIPTENYTPAVARRRRWEQLYGGSDELEGKP